jgi:hypothetical protein
MMFIRKKLISGIIIWGMWSFFFSIEHANAYRNYIPEIKNKYIKTISDSKIDEVVSSSIDKLIDNSFIGTLTGYLKEELPPNLPQDQDYSNVHIGRLVNCKVNKVHNTVIDEMIGDIRYEKDIFTQPENCYSPLRLITGSTIDKMKNSYAELWASGKGSTINSLTDSYISVSGISFPYLIIECAENSRIGGGELGITKMYNSFLALCDGWLDEGYNSYIDGSSSSFVSWGKIYNSSIEEIVGGWRGSAEAELYNSYVDTVTVCGRIKKISHTFVKELSPYSQINNMVNYSYLLDKDDTAKVENIDDSSSIGGDIQPANFLKTLGVITETWLPAQRNVPEDLIVTLKKRLDDQNTIPPIDDFIEDETNYGTIRKEFFNMLVFPGGHATDYGNAPSPYSIAQANFQNFEWLGIGHNINDGALFPSQVYSDTNPTCSIIVSSNYSNMTPIERWLFYGVLGPAQVQAWADWNQNKIWETNELIVNWSGTIKSDNQVITKLFTVPNTAKEGNTWIRTRISSGIIPPAPDGVTWRGEIEDYEIEVVPEPCSMVLIATGLTCLVMVSRRRN